MTNKELQDLLSKLPNNAEIWMQTEGVYDILCLTYIEVDKTNQIPVEGDIPSFWLDNTEPLENLIKNPVELSKVKKIIF